MFKNVLSVSLSMALGMGLIYNQLAPEEKAAKPFNKYKTNEGKAKLAGAYDAYRLKQRADESGKFNYEAYSNALRQADAMQSNGSRAATVQWEEMGPDNVGGRSRCLVVDKDNPNILYTGGVSGGIYISKNGGTSWEAYFNQDDQLAVLPITSMIQTKDGDIYAGTGATIGENASGGEGSGFLGNGIYKKAKGATKFEMLTTTYNAGVLSPSFAFAATNRMAPDRTDNATVYAATGNGLKITKDGGATWTSAPAPLAGGSIATVVVAKDGTIFAGSAGKIFRSKDNGTSFTQVANAFLSEGNRLEITVSDEDPNYVYALGIKAAGSLKFVIQSTNGGETWSQIGFGDPLTMLTFDPFCQQLGTQSVCQGWYDIAFEVHPKDKNKLFLGGAARFYTWSPATGWLQAAKAGDFAGVADYIHADMHHIAFDPSNPEIMYVTCDGGVFKSIDCKKSFPYPHFLPKNRNLNITQFYSVAASKAGEILGGTQDNGTNFISLRENSLKASREVSGGDGFDAEISKVNPNFHFYTVYNGKYYRSAKKGEGVSSIVSSDIDGWDGSPSDGEADGVSFFTKFHLLEVLDSSKSFFIGSSSNGRLYICSNALSIEKLKWYRLIIGGEGECFASSTDGDVLYVGKTGGVTRISGFRNAQDQLDVNGTPTTLANLSAPVTYNIPGGGTVYGITVDPKDENHIIATLGGFGGVNKVFESFNGGVLFTAKQGNLPVMPCYDAVIDATDAKRVLIASELGMWLTEDITQANPVWVEANKGVGRVPTFKLRQENLYTDGCPVIYAGTHGRGLMRTTTFTPTTCNTIVGKTSNIQNIAFDAKSVKISPNPASDFASIEFSSVAEQKASLVIYNTAGAVVKRENIQVSEGINKYSFDIDQINPGNYFVRIQNASTTLGGAKLIVQ